ncbi:uncharacterized protein TRUGW13939_07794 [Talaromyces rugulosus]|uniref:F-box domain-containing protein n=1 Tax=Talaromyces rugulosus TaxID=121627 RepID=A0A7H8R3S4_TALRU|nr:uncharacterized protein TRUGW13939_07794 [Talaromyces rugulosus]QKX60648.1 hypothetical protein TRUGW13939_07794 [Talaromyces rugulosus]
MVDLPLDVLLLILDNITVSALITGDYEDLFQCALTCKSLTKPALSSLYQTPPRDLEEPRLSINEENNARKCANMWRSIILSMCKDRTYLPYYEYIKSFYLGSLRDMLSRSINEDLDELMHRENEDVGGKRLKLSKGDLTATTAMDILCPLIFKKAYKITKLVGNVGKDDCFPLRAWVSHLPNLQSLSLSHSYLLGDNAQESICEHCPSFKELNVNYWACDYQAECVLKGLRPNSLTSFGVAFSYGPCVIRAIGCHSKSLTTLTLPSLPRVAFIELPTIGAFEALETLRIFRLSPETCSGEMIPAVAKWIYHCKNLLYLDLSFAWRTSCIETLMLAVGELNQLRKLQLWDRGSPAQLRALPRLPNLETLNFHGKDMDDDIWPSFFGLEKLTTLRLYGTSKFTARGILDFISQLGPGNKGIYITVRINDKFSEEEVAAIKDTLEQKARGTFDY